MSTVKVSLFSQITSLLDRQSFGKIARKLDTDKHSKGLGSWTHLVSMVFLHLAKVDSVRDISKGLQTSYGNLSHVGIERAPSKSSISYLNKHRNWELFKDYYFELLERMEPSLQRRRKYGHQLKRKIYLMDSTLVSLCVSLFDWAKYRTHKGAIKVHTVLDYDTGLPTFAEVSDGRKHDLKVARGLQWPLGSVLVIDRAYVDYVWLHDLDSKGIIFVTRLKDGTLNAVLKSFSLDRTPEGVIADQNIQLTGPKTSIAYPKPLRIVTFKDPKTGKKLVFLTNQMSWTAGTIADLYKARWDIECFFKQIKQTLRIKTFVGTSYNAVMIQIWTAMITILLLKYLVNQAKYAWHLSNMVTMIRVHLFNKLDMRDFLDKPFYNEKPPPEVATLFE
ncbi:IS4 family transposase [Arthrospira platensis SPKY1]|nr:IS4 family transposase [Arthrospira platensis SPKY1]